MEEDWALQAMRPDNSHGIATGDAQTRLMRRPPHRHGLPMGPHG